MNKYPNALSPLKIGRVQVKNRIETPPMLSCMTTPDGFVTRELIEFYKSFARGGAGIVTIGDAAVDYEYGAGHIGQVNLGDDRAVNGLSVLVEAIQKYGAKISIEINHAGRWASPKVLNGKNPIGPSPIPAGIEVINARLEGRPVQRVTQMDQDMIDLVIEHFANACQRCLASGFEMVMIHGGHGHLLGQFSSPYANKRTDNYGGSLENRARFINELLTAIRRKVGDRLAIEYRISADEMVEGGMHEEETIEFIKLIQDKIDLLHASVGISADPKFTPHMIQPTYFPLAYNVQRAAKIKKAIKIPVTCVGSIMSLETAESIVASGQADIVAMGRAHIADPEIVNKSRRGENNEIRPCLRCNYCGERPKDFYPVRCSVNPVSGRETEYNFVPPAVRKKRVAVVGGGPAGMQAALTASSRGHQVILFESKNELGGTIRIAAIPAFKADMKRYLDWLIYHTEHSPIEIRKGFKADSSVLKDIKPDVLVLATGADLIRPDIPGINRANVLLATEALIGQEITGKEVVIVGAGMTGCETALYLAQQKKNVTVVDMISKSQVAADATSSMQSALLGLLEQYKVKFFTEVKVENISDKGVQVIDKAWSRSEITADAIVISMGAAPRTELVDLAEEIAPEVYIIGDCKNPRNLRSAINEAFEAAVEI